jgi:hypothetical protein
MPESFFSRTLLAYMPFMAYSFGPEQAWRAAALIAGVYWLTLAVFWFTRRLFPEGTVRCVFFLWLGLWGQAAWTALGLSPFWLVSVFLLFPAGFLDEGKAAGRLPVLSARIPKYFAERVLNGVGFFVFAGIFELAGEFMGSFGHAAALRGPVGMFLLFFFAAFLWKNQPALGRNSAGKKDREARP